MAAERRSKIHFGREDPITTFGLARRADFRLNKGQYRGQQSKMKRGELAEITLGEKGRTARLRKGIEARAAGAALFTFVGIVRVT